MLITTKRRYTKKHVIGGAGIFDTITNVLKRIASRLSSAAQTEIGKKVIEVAKEVGKDAVIAKSKALIEGLASKNHEITQKSKDTLASLIAGSGAISIQDLVKRLNTGSGLRLA